MTYTIIEVERKTGVPSRKLRFWLDKGLFPNVSKDKNGVRYFSEKDIEWVIWIECYRTIGMSIKNLKTYIHLCSLGKETLEQRLSIIKEQKQKTLKEMQNLSHILEKLDNKIEYYKDLINKNQDSLNPLSKDYEKIEGFRKKLKKQKNKK